ncbi:MHS family MFS transporter [Pseudoclavibacter sp. CFCC 13796]|uniref:MFS transporter n=1 Tax=unclassified Pseudoclavibacter TaxID=2615177 RepID=UPI0013015403|nr:MULTISPECIES: MFS transporter [unclassified Pseudoclavibacter]KAB1645622.1 MHS family MFS transporter [Pseudoclavibacter sp. CFCC 14310]KAB1645919.1 MHS family MFS transporter [Pseudoclavibacter sp. CFCC 14310]KAB1661372.1 MHS family MFS transporter [Pseudoclavibacter sp. CFCC 13796]KAB1664472.1 MHS family MFS transporter [Pseudoclavibacter sp. CFCC 13611]
MSTTTSPAPGTQTTGNSRARVLVASLIGTTIEFYDFYAYATAAVLVFPVLFFPNDPNNPDHTVQLLSSFAIFGVAFLARPLGSLLFGHFGDRIGRKGTLVASLMFMGIATFLIGCLPTYAQIGYWAPALLALMRFCQGIGLGGEWSGAALVATENAPKAKRALWGTFPQLGAPLGFILANLVFLWLALGLDEEGFLSWGWRVPFLVSIALVAIGLWVRLRLVEAPAFQQVVDRGEIEKQPIVTSFTGYWREIVIGTFLMAATYTVFYLVNTFALTFGTTPATKTPGGLGYDRSTFILLLIFGCVFFTITTLLSGIVADRIGRRRLNTIVNVAMAVFGIVFGPLLGGGFAGLIVFLVVGFSLTGFAFGPMASTLPELFPTRVRYTGSAIAYNLSAIVGAAVAPFIAVWLWSLGGGSAFWVGIYLTVMCLISLVAIRLAPETKDVEYH